MTDSEEQDKQDINEDSHYTYFKRVKKVRLFPEDSWGVNHDER